MCVLVPMEARGIALEPEFQAVSCLMGAANRTWQEQ